MKEPLLELTVEELKNGYRYEQQNKQYVCNLCGAQFMEGEIFRCEDRYFDCEKAAAIHILSAHTSVYDHLTKEDQKYLGLTDNQKELLHLIRSGLSDTEIAQKLEISPSTVRHQKFMFREKAKQAKTYLAVYELALEGRDSACDLIAIHTHAKMLDDRYLTTESEKNKILSAAFSSLTPLRLKSFPPKEKKKIIILNEIAGQLDPARRYTEKELNHILKEIYSDFATIRRYLIEYGFMDRTRDCSEYWLKKMTGM